MPIDRSVVAQSEFFEDDARQNQTFNAFLDFVRNLDAGFAKNRLHKTAGFIVQMRVGLAGHDPVKVICNRADVFGDRPFVVV